MTRDDLPAPDALWTELLEQEFCRGPRLHPAYGLCGCCTLPATMLLNVATVSWAVCAPCGTRWLVGDQVFPTWYGAMADAAEETIHILAAHRGIEPISIHEEEPDVNNSRIAQQAAATLLTNSSSGRAAALARAVGFNPKTAFDDLSATEADRLLAMLLRATSNDDAGSPADLAAETSTYAFRMLRTSIATTPRIGRRDPLVIVARPVWEARCRLRAIDQLVDKLQEERANLERLLEP